MSIIYLAVTYFSRRWNATPFVTVVLIGGGFALPSAPASAQQIDELTATPAATAALFLRSVRAIRWTTTAELLDRQPLARFHETVTYIVESDSSGALGTYLVDTSAQGLRDLDARDVFARSMEAVIGDMPGLMNALYDRDDDVIGAIPEGADAAHAVYRTTARISGAVPEVKVMQLRRSRDGWRVVWSDELEVLDAALRGVGRE